MIKKWNLCSLGIDLEIVLGKVCIIYKSLYSVLKHCWRHLVETHEAAFMSWKEHCQSQQLVNSGGFFFGGGDRMQWWIMYNYHALKKIGTFFNLLSFFDFIFGKMPFHTHCSLSKQICEDACNLFLMWMCYDMDWSHEKLNMSTRSMHLVIFKLWFALLFFTLERSNMRFTVFFSL